MVEGGIRNGCEAVNPVKEECAATPAVVYPRYALKGPAIPMPGTILTRLYREKNIRVTVLEKGFEYEGQVYRSLSAIAKVITGTNWNGFGFFGILNKGHKK